MARRELAGCRVVLTGASSGIGWHLALELAKHRVEILATARRGERLQQLTELVQQAGSTCTPIDGDLCNDHVRTQIATAVADRWNGLDVCINCAGVGAIGPFLGADAQRLRRIFEVNFFAPAELIRILAPALKRGRDPLIVNVGSVLGHRAVPFKSEYCASKFALHGFSDALRAELAPQGIEVLIVSPSTTDSEFFDAVLEDRLKRDWKGKHPMAPQRVARIAVAAMQRRKHEVILSAGGRALVWLDRFAPTWADFLVARMAR